MCWNHRSNGTGSSKTERGNGECIHYYQSGMDFYEGVLEGKKVVVVQSGIGKVNAGMCTQILADLFQVEAVINTGIAGSLNNDINIGDIVLSTDVLHHDMDATGFGYPKGQIPQMKEFSFQADECLRKIAHDVCEEVNPEIRVFEGRIASGDQFVCDQGVKDNIVKEFSAYAVEMEGAAIGQAAALNGIPFLIIRAISDKADNSANMDYPAFEKLAIEHSVRLTQGMLKRDTGLNGTRWYAEGTVIFSSAYTVRDSIERGQQGVMIIQIFIRFMLHREILFFIMRRTENRKREFDLMKSYYPRIQPERSRRKWKKNVSFWIMREAVCMMNIRIDLCSIIIRQQVKG